MIKGKPTLVCIGAGKLAYHLTKSLHKEGYKILQVISRTCVSSSKLAIELNAEYDCNFTNIVKNADLYILAVNDDALPSVIENLPSELNRVVHTSGSTPMDIFKGKFNHTGVLYPFQTFTRERNIDLKPVPFLIEGSDTETIRILKLIADDLSDKVLEMNSEQRRLLHIAAVFACNFSNYMMTISEEFLKSEKMDFSLLKPLITETFSKAANSLPSKVQTGPAVRNDRNIINQHISLLNNYPEYQKMYTFVSQSIIDYYNKKTDE